MPWSLQYYKLPSRLAWPRPSWMPSSAWPVSMPGYGACTRRPSNKSWIKTTRTARRRSLCFPDCPRLHTGQGRRWPQNLSLPSYGLAAEFPDSMRVFLSSSSRPKLSRCPGTGMIAIKQRPGHGHQDNQEPAQPTCPGHLSSPDKHQGRDRRGAQSTNKDHKTPASQTHQVPRPAPDCSDHIDCYGQNSPIAAPKARRKVLPGALQMPLYTAIKRDFGINALENRRNQGTNRPRGKVIPGGLQFGQGPPFVV